MKNWYYLSFASTEEFLGGCVVQAASTREAVREAARHGIAPGGEVAVIPAPGNVQGPLPANRLLSRAELEHYDPAGGATLAETEARGLMPPEDAEIFPEAVFPGDGEAEA